jgi:hypothetical protein
MLVQTPQANLSQGIGWFQTTYTVRFNRRHRRSGHLYQGRFKAHLVEEDVYAGRLVLYVHLNPVRPRNKRQVIPSDRRGELRRCHWSSHLAYAGQAKAPDWLSLDWLGYFDRTKGAARREYKRQVASCFGCRLPNPFDELRGGLVLGGETLWEKACRVLEGAEGDEEIRWRRRTGRQSIEKQIRACVEGEEDRRIQMWIRVRLGGQRMTEVAREYGYRDGSGVHQVVRRLEARAKDDLDLANHLRHLRKVIKA